MWGVRGLAEWREFAAAGALQSLEITSCGLRFTESLASACTAHTDDYGTQPDRKVGSAQGGPGKGHRSCALCGRPDFPGNDPRRHCAKLPRTRENPRRSVRGRYSVE